ncbi:hypothetical protein [Clostridium ganghwense]|uniref:Glycosyl hydrolase-like 10 domain-containing protein n=1 Tax=Clostridium ganghwense TaxID=312089 RepID=A0ABT4CKL3_9CLOT|nr:hypothetical protein [Clostridium ganghwense]MCY6369597.1 hypothetical protein [Clostridium ganghwense]
MNNRIKKLFILYFISFMFLFSSNVYAWDEKDVQESLVNLKSGETITAESGKIYLFKCVQKMVNNENEEANRAGWGASVFKGDNKGVIIESTDKSQELELPLKLNGWFKIDIGYAAGTDSFIVKETEKDNSYNYVENNEAYDAHKLYGNQYIYEKRALISNFNGNSIKISPYNNYRARIAYIKLVGLTSEEIAAYNKSDEGASGRRIIYDFDGYSDFFSGSYPTVDSLKKKTVDVLSKKNVGEINWCLGTTGMLTYNSRYAGKAFEGVDRYDNQLREGDKLAREQILNILKTGKSPLEVVADEAEKKGVKINASLRMDAFYNPKIYGFLNGAMYDEYKDCVQEGSFSMNYTYPKFRDYIKNILREAASFKNVDGITLDFCRYPTVMGSQTTKIYKNFYRAIIMNKFMKEVRAEIPKNKNITVRIPYKNPLSYGFDVETWIEKGYIDRLIISNISKEDFFDITPYVEMVKGTKVKLYIGIVADVKGHDLTKAEEELMKKGLYVHEREYLKLDQYLSRAYDVYKKGADGVFLFNTSSNLLIDTSAPTQATYLGDKVLIHRWYNFQYNEGNPLRKEKVFITKFSI